MGDLNTEGNSVLSLFEYYRGQYDEEARGVQDSELQLQITLETIPHLACSVIDPMWLIPHFVFLDMGPNGKHVRTMDITILIFKWLLLPQLFSKSSDSTIVRLETLGFQRLMGHRSHILSFQPTVDGP